MTAAPSPLPTRQVGRTALRVPILGLGTAPLHRSEDSVAVATVERALAEGVNFFDTAPLYGNGRSERLLGTALKGVPRDSYIVSTKVGRLTVEGDGPLPFDYSRDAVLRSFESSLERLGIDRIDILLVHDPDDHPEEALATAFPTLAELRSQGVIGAIGSGMNQWQMLAHFARNFDIDCFLLAGRYTLLEQTALDEFLPLCEEKGISIFTGGVYNSGILALGPDHPAATYNYEPAPPAITDKARRIEAICARHGVSLQVAAANFPLGHPAITALLIGGESPAQFAETAAALRTPVPSALWRDLREAGLLRADAPVPGDE
jgi:D-threo-aldose 1-dehydrogenase